MCMPENIKSFSCVYHDENENSALHHITATYEHTLPVFKINTY